jgi:Spy/CpxP family protein refolding chaperone
MNKQAGVMTVFVAALLATAPGAHAQAPAAAHEVQVTMDSDDIDVDGMGDDLFAWTDDEGGEFAFMSDEDGGAGGAGGERRVIVRRFQGGPGMGGPEGPGMHGGPGMGPGGPRMRGAMMHARWAQLGLSDAQNERLRAIHEAHARKAIQMRADLQIAKLDMAKLMRADRPDAGAINAQIDRMARMRADAAKARVGVMLEARTVLTAEQLQKLKEHRPMPMRMMHGDDAMPGDGKSGGGMHH